MRIITSLITIWATCLGVASGYEMPGAYERVMFYYAYIAECKETNNNPNRIAANCAKAPNVCSFDRFMEYILEKGNTPITVNIHNKGPDDLPDIDDTAKKLYNAGLTGPVDNSHVWEGAGTNFAEVLSNVAGYAERSFFNDEIPDAVKKGMVTSMKKVHGERIQASATSWEPLGKDVILKTVNPFGFEFQTVDFKKLAAKYPGWDAQADFVKHVGDGHLNNILALKSQLESIKLYESSGC